MHRKTIKTSDPNWVKKAMACYGSGESFGLFDDAGLGVSAQDVTSGFCLMAAARRRFNVPFGQIAQILAGLGVSAVGVWLVMAALADPEPTTELGLLVGGGLALAVTGSLSVLWSLGIKWQVEVRDGNFTVSPA